MGKRSTQTESGMTLHLPPLGIFFVAPFLDLSKRILCPMKSWHHLSQELSTQSLLFPKIPSDSIIFAMFQGRGRFALLASNLLKLAGDHALEHLATDLAACLGAGRGRLQNLAEKIVGDGVLVSMLAENSM